MLRDDDGSSTFGDRIQDRLSFLLSEAEGEKRTFSVKCGSMLSGVVAREANQKKKVEAMAATATGLSSGEK